MDAENTVNRPPISLLWPGEERDFCMKNSASAASDLGFDDLFDLKCADLTDFFTDDPDVIAYRAETFSDVMTCSEALEALKKSVPIMADITDLRRLGSESDSADEYLYSITEVELYMSLLDHLKATLLPHKDRLASRGMKALCERVEELSDSEGYREINESLRELSSRVRDVSSVTLGVNLDARLFPESAGLLSINKEKFRSGQKLEKILHIDFKSDERDFIAPLVEPSRAFGATDRDGLRRATLSALGTVFKTSFKSWRRIVRAYVLENSDFLLSLLPEIEFLSKAGEFITKLRERGVALSTPRVTKEGKTYRARGLVNPAIALATACDMVPNDVEFDSMAGIYIITGPNRGGKSVFTAAVGQSVIMAQLGLPVCAEELEMSVCDDVFCHFPTGDDTVERGRLGEECSRLADIVSKITGQSLVLLDESLSSTGSIEATEIAEELLCGLSAVGCRAIFSTHLHTLASDTAAINERSAAYGGVKIDNLVAEMAGGERSFKIVREAPKGKSFASDVARKYGLSLDDVLKRVTPDEE